VLINESVLCYRFESATTPLVIDEASSRRIGGIEHATAGISTA